MLKLMMMLMLIMTVYDDNVDYDDDDDDDDDDSARFYACFIECVCARRSLTQQRRAMTLVPHLEYHMWEGLHLGKLTGQLLVACPIRCKECHGFSDMGNQLHVHLKVLRRASPPWNNQHWNAQLGHDLHAALYQANC